jgi:hypothetical protein
LTVNKDDTIELAETADGTEREMDDGAAISDLAADVFLHPVGHVDQTPPGLFEE